MSVKNSLITLQLPLRVSKAVECEKLVSSILHQDLKHSTSCRDVTSSFYHIKDLWNQMGWQEVHNNRSLLAASVDVINSYTINIDGAVGVNSQYPPHSIV